MINQVPGWPASLPPPGTAEFAQRVTGWLLDRGPAELRGSGLTASPVLLAYVVLRHVEGALESLRQAYGGIRADLPDDLSPEALVAGQQAMEKVGASLGQQAREVALVFRALRT